MRRRRRRVIVNNEKRGLLLGELNGLAPGRHNVQNTLLPSSRHFRRIECSFNRVGGEGPREGDGTANDGRLNSAQVHMRKVFVKGNGANGGISVFEIVSMKKAGLHIGCFGVGKLQHQDTRTLD